MEQDARDEWVARVLKVNLPRAHLGKLADQWRMAQNDAVAALASFGQALLKLPDVAADPRVQDVKSALPALPRLIPDHESALASLEDGDAQQALAAIAAYRQQLAAANTMQRLEQFANKHIGDLGVATMLNGALGEIETRLQRA
jgi:hypothetical protein